MRRSNLPTDPVKAMIRIRRKLEEKMKNNPKLCSCCGIKNDLQVDHIIPIHFVAVKQSKGSHYSLRCNQNHPINKKENLQWLCKKCNLNKSTKFQKEDLFKVFTKEELKKLLYNKTIRQLKYEDREKIKPFPLERNYKKDLKKTIDQKLNENQIHIS